MAQAQASDRVALVIGNSAYPSSPLVNPKNDAVAMTALLQSAGFAVDRQLDATQQQLKAAVDRFGATLRDPQIKFAMFYYAGHGVQLEWRNYLIPVNARVRNADDVRKQTVDVSDLLRYMEESKGKSFLVILDACRDDPFSGTYQSTAKGLSQFDAPVGSLLAFSTSPGNVALDGEGDNGLYTSHLLREFAVRGVKLEDAFKRVRLNVRLASQGKQIPWESTSLEEDVYLFPSDTKKLSEAERSKLVEQEIEHWLRLKSSTDTAALASFLREYPSGSASELAQSRLNRLLAAEADRERQRLALAAAASATAATAARERAEAQALAQAKAIAVAAAARAAAERASAERVAAERAEAERVATAYAVAERVAAARAETERQQLATQQEAQRRQAEQQQALQRAAAQAEAAGLAEQRAKAAQAQALAATQAEASRVAQQRAKEAAEAQAQAALAVAREREGARLAEAQARESQRQAQLAEQARVALVQEEAARVQSARAALEQLTRQQVQAQRAQQVAERQAREAVTVAVATTAVAPAGPTEQPSQPSLPATPYYKGFAEHDRRYRVGDLFQFRVIDKFNQAQTPLELKVSAVDTLNDRIDYNEGEYQSDTMGNIVRNLRGGMSTPRQFYPAELFVGKKWRTQFKQSRANGTIYFYTYDLKVVAKETVTVPAGTFEAFKIEARGFNDTLGARLERNIWVTPGISADIVHETLVRLRNGVIEQNDRQELTAFTLTK